MIRRHATALLLLWVLAPLPGCGKSGPDALETSGAIGRISVEVVNPADGSVVAGNAATLDVRVSGLALRPPDGDRSGDTGHLVVFVGEEPVGPGEQVPRAVLRSWEDRVLVPGLAVGPNKLTVVVADGAGRRLTAAARVVDLTVTGPSVRARARHLEASGGRARLEVGGEGVEIASVPGDSSGRTGLLHFFIDREPTPAGVPIPDPPDGSIVHADATSVELPPLPPGEHVVWIVAGDGNHVPLSPPVMDRVIVVVE